MIRWPTLRPDIYLVATFAGLIFVGTVLLRLPVSHADPGKPVGWVDALFTATSAVCVTGLATVDIATAYTRFGHVVILALIQLGGLGIMTFAAAFYQLFARRLSVGSHAILQDTFFQPEARTDFRQAFKRIVFITLSIELCGALLIFWGMPRHGPVVGTWFDALFLAISAYCNAGFALWSSNLIDVRDHALIVWPIMGLITLGGLGYTVLFELIDRAKSAILRRRHRPLMWTLNARVVLRVSAVLTFGGAAFMLVTGMTRGETGWWERSVHALFQSVSARTAGFNTVDVGALPLATLMILIGLMFVGGSPGSCAGGIKTTSLAVGAAGAVAGMTGAEHVNLLGRRVPLDVLQRTALVVALAALWQLFGVVVLAITEQVGQHGVETRFEQVIFEQVSAFNTVGLTANLTPKLSDPGKLWISLSMFAGRLGPLTIAIAVLKRPQSRYEFPVERVMIG